MEQTLQGRFDLKINADKTRTAKLNEPGGSLDFLGYTFRYDRDLRGRDQKYLNLCPSSKAFRQINAFVQERLIRHLNRRNQRPFRKRGESSWYAHLHRMGLQPL